MLALAACGGGDSTTTKTTDGPDALDDPNAGTHRYRYVELTENAANGCETSAKVGDELNRETVFADANVMVTFVRDDLPEGAEPGSRHYDVNLGEGVWSEEIESSDGDGLYVHTIEFTETGVVMTTTLAGEPCFYSVRERIDQWQKPAPPHTRSKPSGPTRGVDYTVIYRTHEVCIAGSTLKSVWWGNRRTYRSPSKLHRSAPERSLAGR